LCVIANAVAGFSLGQLQTFGESKRMSALALPAQLEVLNLPFYALSIPKADESGTNAQVGSGPKSDLLRDAPKSMLVPNSKASLNHVSRCHKQIIGERKPQRLRCSSIEEEFNLRRFFDREIIGFGTLQYLIYESSRAATHRNLISSIGHQRPGFQSFSGPNG